MCELPVAGGSPSTAVLPPEDITRSCLCLAGRGTSNPERKPCGESSCFGHGEHGNAAVILHVFSWIIYQWLQPFSSAPDSTPMSETQQSAELGDNWAPRGAAGSARQLVSNRPPAAWPYRERCTRKRSARERFDECRALILLHILNKC